MGRLQVPLVVVAVVAVVTLVSPGAGRADDGDARIERTCTGRSTVQLRVRGRDDDLLRVDLTVRTTRRGATWGVVVVHERRLARRAHARTSLSSGSFSRRFTVADWPGRDAITVRALGPGGEVCRASVVVSED
jgi:hypothetical protein